MPYRPRRRAGYRPFYPCLSASSCRCPAASGFSAPPAYNAYEPDTFLDCPGGDAAPFDPDADAVSGAPAGDDFSDADTPEPALGMRTYPYGEAFQKGTLFPALFSPPRAQGR